MHSAGDAPPPARFPISLRLPFSNAARSITPSILFPHNSRDQGEKNMPPNGY
ncbi:hypothetical protein AGMMS49940_03580 [Spirochaetia bacterium]|nr:hypothetical protein AGMMS49940_03580 [Spirochaetia bacterium]